MRLLFCRSRSIPSWLVRLFTWSKFSHVALVSPDGTMAIEAVWPRVRLGTTNDIYMDNDTVVEIDLSCAHPEAAWAWAKEQVGKRYDLVADFGVGLHRDWRDPNEWNCSELVAETFSEGGSPLFRAEVIDRVTPQMLWELPGTLCPNMWCSI